MENPQVILSWKAPLRPYKKRGKIIIRFYLTIAFLLSVIIIFFSEPILLIPIWAVLFLFYTFTITPPPEIENKITIFGIETAGITLRWEALSYFYFKTRFGFTVLVLVSNPPYFYHAYLVIPDKETKDRVFSIISQKIVYKEKPVQNITDKMVDWLSQLIPDEEDVPAENEKVGAPSL